MIYGKRASSRANREPRFQCNTVDPNLNKLTYVIYTGWYGVRLAFILISIIFDTVNESAEETMANEEQVEFWNNEAASYGAAKRRTWTNSCRRL